MIIGVTGIIGSGKSTVAALLAKRFAAQVIDADKVGHKVLERQWLVRLGVKYLFGSLERQEIARQVFASKTKLFLLNALTHPFIRRYIKRQLRASRDNFILDAALLFPLRLSGCCDHIVFVTAHKVLLYKRLAAKGYAPAQIEQRLTANRGVYKYQKKALLLPNDSSLAHLEEAVSSLQF